MLNLNVSSCAASSSASGLEQVSAESKSRQVKMAITIDKSFHRLSKLKFSCKFSESLLGSYDELIKHLDVDVEQ